MKGMKVIKKEVNDEGVKEMIPCQISAVFSTTVNSLLCADLLCTVTAGIWNCLDIGHGFQ